MKISKEFFNERLRPKQKTSRVTTDMFQTTHRKNVTYKMYDQY